MMTTCARCECRFATTDAFAAYCGICRIELRDPERTKRAILDHNAWVASRKWPNDWTPASDAQLAEAEAIASDAAEQERSALERSKEDSV